MRAANKMKVYSGNIDSLFNFFRAAQKNAPDGYKPSGGQGSCVRLNDSVLTFSTASAEQLLIDCVAGFALGNTSDSSIIIVPKR